MDKNNRRRSLGGSRTNPTLQAASASVELRNIQTFIDKDEREIVHVTPSDIKKTFNARFIPCSLDEFGQVLWPDLELSVDEAKEEYPKLLHGFSFWSELSDSEKSDFIEFLGGVHSTANSMVRDLQIHPVTLERESPESTDYFIVDGERRSLSALYSRGRIPVVKAYVYNRLLSPVERAQLKDIANTALSLTVYETILSKFEIYKSSEGAKSLNVRDLGNLLGYKKDLAATLKKVFDHENRDALLHRVKKERLGWRDINYLLKNGIGAPITKPGAEDINSSPNAKALSNGKTKGESLVSSDISSLEERISQFVGYPCSLNFNEGSKKVKLTFRTSLNDFESLLASLQRIDVEKVLEK
jgi:hypothetical protein